MKGLKLREFKPRLEKTDGNMTSGMTQFHQVANRISVSGAAALRSEACRLDCAVIDQLENIAITLRSECYFR